MENHLKTELTIKVPIATSRLHLMLAEMDSSFFDNRCGARSEHSDLGRYTLT